MRLTYVLMGLLSFSVSAQVLEFESQILTLANEENASKAREELQAVKNLDDRLTKALEAGGREEFLALELIKRLPRPSMMNFLLKGLEKTDPESISQHERILALASLCRGKEAYEILEKLKNLILSQSKIPASVRLAILSAMGRNNLPPDAQTLTKLIDDESFEIRMLVMELMENGFEKNSEAYLSLLHKALVLSPYPVRLRGLDYLKRLPEDKRKTFEKEVQNCRKTESNELVLKSCLEFKL